MTRTGYVPSCNVRLLPSVKADCGRGAELALVGRHQRCRAGAARPSGIESERHGAANFSQAQFAEVLGISKRTLQEWEQGRRSPSGAARTLIHIARRHPEVLREARANG
ncbi:MAG: helix-turn-helix domain-containing protein [Wenzhouxiangellaceae bacterium]